MRRRTKIIATIGPACEDEASLRGLMEAGMDVARLGLAHGDLDGHLERYHRIRRVAAESGRLCGILVDLPGPKIRLADFGTAPIDFEKGSRCNVRVGADCSTIDDIEIEYPGLLSDVQVGDRLNIGDGRLLIDIVEKGNDLLVAEVAHGGRLSGRPGVHVPADRLQMATPTDEDLVALDAFIEVGVDMVAVSFVRSAHDVRRVGTEPHPRGPLVVAKIETRAAVDNLTGIIEASGAVMVARGDLGNECSIEDLPPLQKEIIRECIALGRPVITATQMLESMITNPAPTRAEASDVANAVWDGSSSVMLSGETAIGHDPINVVRTMSRIARRADEEFDHHGWAAELAELRMTDRDGSSSSVTDAMTLAGWRAAEELGVDTIVCISGSGFTVRSMARFRPRAQVLGFSQDPRTVQQLTMSWGTVPIQLDPEIGENDRVAESLIAAREQGHVASGDLVAVLAGAASTAPSTNILRIERVP
ncbi:MAG: pyruvate kinase [Acidimicrobiia bacterium]|nr:pyruvate kinase [Acidimicrobiia bacterium]MDH5236040.1 pyruvate kinase [Acidimicrobiia bacterium]